MGNSPDPERPPKRVRYTQPDRQYEAPRSIAGLSMVMDSGSRMPVAQAPHLNGAPMLENAWSLQSELPSPSQVLPPFAHEDLGSTWHPINAGETWFFIHPAPLDHDLPVSSYTRQIFRKARRCLDLLVLPDVEHLRGILSKSLPCEMLKAFPVPDSLADGPTASCLSTNELNSPLVLNGYASKQLN